LNVRLEPYRFCPALFFLQRRTAHQELLPVSVWKSSCAHAPSHVLV
jgi:hypothetical protein